MFVRALFQLYLNIRCIRWRWLYDALIVHCVAFSAAEPIFCGQVVLIFESGCRCRKMWTLRLTFSIPNVNYKDGDLKNSFVLFFIETIYLTVFILHFFD
jgi:hypothetical protein